MKLTEYFRVYIWNHKAIAFNNTFNCIQSEDVKYLKGNLTFGIFLAQNKNSSRVLSLGDSVTGQRKKIYNTLTGKNISRYMLV